MGIYLKGGIISLALLLVAALFISLGVRDKDNNEWNELSRVRGEIKQLVYEKDFEQLEKRVHEARTQKLKLKSMNWVLHELYNAIPASMETYESIYEFVDDWRGHSPESNIPDIIEARAFLARSWQLRGNSTSQNLSSSEYSGFKEYLSKSWQSIEAAEKKGPIDPEICTVKTRLAFVLIGDKELAKQIFSECVEIEPGYIHLYFGMLNYLQPRWFGSDKEMLQFVEDSADATKHMYGDGLYSLLAYAHTYNTNEIFVENDGIFTWERTKSGYQEILIENGSSSHILHSYGYLAMLAYDYEALAEVLNETGKEWDDLKEKYYRKQSWYEYHLSKAKAHL